MKLASMTVKGYRSIRSELSVLFDHRITVVLGANDHGKSNLLAALLHLNYDAPFEAEDLNWDCEDSPEVFPHLTWTLQLEASEREELARLASHEILTSEFDAFEALLAEQHRLLVESGEALDRERDDSGDPSEDEDAQASESFESSGRTSSSEAEAIRKQIDVAEQRMALAHALRVEAIAELRGHEADLERLAKEAEAEVAEAQARVDGAEAALENAEEELLAVEQTHAAGSTELQEAESLSAQAVQELDDAKDLLQRQSVRARRARMALTATGRYRSGVLRFDKESPPPTPRRVKPDEIGPSVKLDRQGMDSELEIYKIEGVEPESAYETVWEWLPRPELIRPQDALADSITASSLKEPENEFMRGIFHYAGLAPAEWDGIFNQSNRSTKRLDRASEQLNDTLRDAWSQGTSLSFRLRHHGASIDLELNDPAVEGRYVEASKRSSGFTHFFALKTVLYARSRESGAGSFIWLFDEPGTFLHPAGQHDLIQVLETLAHENQVVYTTHSVFLINKNFPSRHRLLAKTGDGTHIDQKPFVGRWRTAIDALGLSLPGSVLFAGHMLLVEGDSDPIFLNADLQKLAQLDAIDFDLNPLAIMSTGDSKHADALVRILLEATAQPKLALLFDGDKGGLDRRRSLKKLVQTHKLPVLQLQSKTSLEDHLLAPELFRDAALSYVIQASDAKGRTADAISDEFRVTFSNLDISAPSGLASWARDLGSQHMPNGEEPSSVGVAREYARLLAATDASDHRMSRSRALKLANKIEQMLELQPRVVEQVSILSAQ